VVFDGIEDEGDGAEVSEGSTKVAEEMWFKVGGDEREAVFGGEDDVEVDGGEGVGHGGPSAKRVDGVSVGEGERLVSLSTERVAVMHKGVAATAANEF
jgi:hypothetical protein